MRVGLQAHIFWLCPDCGHCFKGSIYVSNEPPEHQLAILEARCYGEAKFIIEHLAEDHVCS